MKIAVMGAGGVGGYFGARLAAAGNEVTFIARGAQLEAIKGGGLKVESPLGDLHIHPARASGDAGDIGPVDAVVFAPKLWGTEEAGAAIRPLVGAETAVISFQNGVDAADRLIPILGSGPVMGGVAAIAATIAAPGVIRHLGAMASLAFGELDGERSRRAEAFLGACRAAHVKAEISDDIVKRIWAKFILLVGLSGATAATRKPAGPIREDADTRAFLLALMEETAAVAQAKGIGIDEGFAAGRMEIIDSFPADMEASMARDLARGNRLELEWLQGEVVRLGRELGVATPANAFVYAALKLSAEGAAA